MVTNKKRKSRKLRGSGTHGWGRSHRGKGNKGGSGNAGRGKKAHVKRFEVAKIKNYFGKRGFKKKGQEKPNYAIDLRTLAEKLKKWSAAGTIKDNVIDLTKLGYTKLLSTGKATKMVITVDKATPKAIKKVQQAGGSVHLRQEGLPDGKLG